MPQVLLTVALPITDMMLAHQIAKDVLCPDGHEVTGGRQEQQCLLACVSSQWCRLLQEEQVCSGPMGPKHSDQTQQEKAECITVTVLASSIATLVFWKSGTRVLL